MRPAGAGLVEGQFIDTVWKNSVLCANCRQGWAEHCKVHLTPCCPDRCPVENKPS